MSGNDMAENQVTSATVTLPQGSRVWTCPKCKTECVIPPDVPADAQILCPTCAKAEQPKPERRSKVAIIGFADSWTEAPYHNPDWEIWCLSAFYSLAAGKVDFKKLNSEGRLVWFDCHRRYDLENDPNVIARNPDHVKKLAGLDCPIYMHQHWDDVPKSVPYPLEQMTAMFGRYWTNSISYEIALAIAGGFKEIGLYGVNMAMDSEWGFQRPSCEYFIGWARGAGIKVHLPLQSDLLKAPYVYGYEDDKASKFLAKIDQLIGEHTSRMTNEWRERDQHDANGQQFNGAIQILQVLRRDVNLGK